MSDRPSRENRESILLPILLPVGVLVVIVLILFLFSRVLLAISHNAATVVACISAAGVITVASLVASRKRLTGSALLPMVGTIFGIALVAGGVAIVAVGPQKEPVEPLAVALSAPVGAALNGFAEKTLSFQADRPTDIDFDNQDAGASHNVVIFQGKDEKAPVVFTGALVAGPGTTTYNVAGLAAGSYFFHCQVHPTTMTGTITVTPAPAGGGSAPTGPSITAAGLAFNTAELDVPADTATTLTFINNDPGTPHNFAVFKDAAYVDKIFTGDLITGPATQDYHLPALAAGTYYFKCDVHPTMTGTLVVTPGSGGGSGSGTPSPAGASSSP
jgi:plastocyanin